MSEQTHATLEGVRVLVTGATGFTGQVLTRKLCEIGADVCAIARPTSKKEGLSDLNIEWIEGQVYDPDVVKKACEGVEVIFNLATSFRDLEVDEEEQIRVHVGGAKLLAEEVVDSPNFKRFVQVSTVGVHGHIDQPPATEDYRMAPSDDYQKTKLDAEVWLQEFRQKRSLPLTIIRPAQIFGPGDRRLLKLFKMAKQPLFFIVGQGKCLLHFVHVDDLANAIILSVTNPGAEGETFIIGDNESVTLESVGREIAAEFETSQKVFRLPSWPFEAAAHVCEAICRPLGWKPILGKRRLHFYFNDRSFNTEKMRTKLGYECQAGGIEGLKRTAEWYKEKGWL